MSLTIDDVVDKKTNKLDIIAFFAKNMLLPWLMPDDTFKYIGNVFAKINQKPDLVQDFCTARWPVIADLLSNYRKKIASVHRLHERTDCKIECVVETIVYYNQVLQFIFLDIEQRLNGGHTVGTYTSDYFENTNQFVTITSLGVVKEATNETPVDFIENVRKIEEIIHSDTRQYIEKRKTESKSKSFECLDKCRYGVFEYKRRLLAQQLGDYLIPLESIIDLMSAIQIRYPN